MKKIIYLLSFLCILLCSIACEETQPYYDDPVYYQSENVQTGADNQINDNTTITDDGSVWDTILVILIALTIAASVVYFFIALVPLKLWFQARLSRVKVSWFLLIKMKWQNIPQSKILYLLVKAQNAHLSLDPKQLCDHYLAGVDITVVVDTLIRAGNAKLKISVEEMAQQYLAKVDVTAIIHALIMAKNAKINVEVTDLAAYYLAGVNVIDLIKAKIVADNSGFSISLNDLKEHYLAGGNLEKTIEAYISAKKANLPDFEFKDIAAIDLSNLDVIESIKSAITPHVIETDGVRGIARDGVEVTMKVKVTIRSHIKNIIGGVSEETVLARVNEGLATQIGMSKSHNDVLQNPYEIADRVENSNLHESSAFEILSVDVSDLKVGNDVGANLKSVRAKAMAEEARAELILAEEKVQKAMASAFLDGNLSIKDYYDIKNKQADTQMRESFAKYDTTKNNNIQQQKEDEDSGIMSQDNNEVGNSEE
ncbi:MAG: flotillin-like FloA family protein [Bacteroidales bacterium]|nr:flotillin-like FloA family protein [Bacteroidales bacterium]